MKSNYLYNNFPSNIYSYRIISFILNHNGKNIINILYARINYKINK